MAVAGVTACLGSHLDGLPLPPLFEVNHAPTKQPTVSNHYPGIGYLGHFSFSDVFNFVGVNDGQSKTYRIRVYGDDFTARIMRCAGA